MRNDNLTIYFDDAGWVTLRTVADEYSFEVGNRFTEHDVRQALCSTGWVDLHNGQLVVTNNMNCRSIGEYAGEMFGYFLASDEPDDSLLQVKRVVDEAYLDEDSPRELPLWSYAWLDLVVRDDLADSARDAKNLWQDDTLLIDIRRRRDHRVMELLDRLSRDDAFKGRRAPSTRSRPSDTIGKTGTA